MLDRVERRRVLEQPAREHLVPGGIGPRALALGDDHLDEGAGFRRGFPRRGPLAGGEAHDHVAHPARFARLELDVLGEVVALVEQAQRRHPLLTRGAEPGILHRCRRPDVTQFLGDFRLFRLAEQRLVGTTRDRRQHRQG